MRIVQFTEGSGRQRLGVSTDTGVRLVSGFDHSYDAVLEAIRAGVSLQTLLETRLEAAEIPLDEVHAPGRLLLPIRHPDDAHCFVTGTGLTHLGSALARDAMHRDGTHTDGPSAGDDTSLETDSIRMFRSGLKGGKPNDGIGAQPEWFYKGDGSCVVAPGATLEVPSFASDGSEEPEIAGIYVIADDGTPWRVGFALANEFSDHIMERENYLLLAHSKLRPCSFGPELLLGDLPQHVQGKSRVVRDGKIVWEQSFLTGERNMSHFISNLEHHHFKYRMFRRPGDLHVHFFGTATLSFTEGVRTHSGDVLELEAAPFGSPLSNPIAWCTHHLPPVRPL